MRKDPTRNTRQTRHRAAAKAAGGAFISTPIGPEAAQALERMAESRSRMKPDPTRNTRAALADLMAAHSLTRAEVCRLLGINVRRYSSSTIDAWLSGARNMPAAKLELLQLKLTGTPAHQD